ncbi:MAG TPA: hypothetical protein VGS19_03435 [Streptosporangiaceae bacterium]|nr:hypothetical protein [Streptosporangiaceae bacterium]
MDRSIPGQCRELLETQHGVIARWQAAGLGINARAIDAKVQRGGWQVMYRGVYCAFTGDAPRIALLWGAVLRTGPDAALSHHSSAELDGLIDKPAPVIHVAVGRHSHVSADGHGPAGRSPAIVVHRSAQMPGARHPSRLPPRTRVEETTLDLAHGATNVAEATAWLASACSRRLTTATLLRAAIEARPRLRWRKELSDALADVGEGAHSALEWRYVRQVERPHALPRARRQAPSRAGSRMRYLDNRYEKFNVVVELDGQAAHPLEARWSDIHRDNASAAMGLTTLRYGWADVTMRPCLVATEVAVVLRNHGWTGRPRACGPQCQVLPTG